MQLFLKMLTGMANIVDPDQEQSGLGLHCLHMPFMSDTLVFKILGHFLISPQKHMLLVLIRSALGAV